VTHPALAIVGPTASGKSDVALAVAEQVPGVEVVSIDSMQVYRGMDIGTAKPTPEVRVRVPHHLIDLMEPSAEMSMSEFQRHAEHALADIDRRGAIAVAVGGTGLYVQAVLDRLEAPGRWPAVRAELEAELDAGTSPADLHARLAALDPLAASRMEPSNERRIVRALEVCIGSGRAFSSFGPGMSSYPAIDTHIVGLRWPRPELARRIAARTATMLDAGWLDEVRALRSLGVELSSTARHALGYGELLAHLDGAMTLDDAIATTILRTQRYAVRQERWFRRDPRVTWVDMADASNAVPAIEACARVLVPA
jgi:tRNA dimethylallyltransferase